VRAKHRVRTSRFTASQGATFATYARLWCVWVNVVGGVIAMVGNAFCCRHELFVVEQGVAMSRAKTLWVDVLVVDMRHPARRQSE
jgi:redox-sensitive bicupin YhaK (pirin superfamily)